MEESNILEDNDVNHEDLNDLIFGDLTLKWHQTINSIAKLFDIPVAIIFKREGDNIRVMVTNDSNENPFRENDVIPIQGSFCNYVFEADGKFKVADYRAIDLDINNVASQGDFISYLGYPLKWPNGDCFGTICVLDDATNYFSGNIETFLLNLSELLNDSLKLIDINLHQERVIDHLNQAHERLPTASSLGKMCRTCHQVIYNDQWYALDEFLTNHPDKQFCSISSEKIDHQCQ